MVLRQQLNVRALSICQNRLANRTSYFDNEIGFFQGFLLKNHLLHTHYLGFD